MAQFLEWTKALGLPALTVAIAFLSVITAFWQVSIAREKLRRDLYDRRFAIYIAFHKLLIAVVEKQDIETELREANAARAQSPFLLDQRLGIYLDKLYREAFRINETKKLYSDTRFAPLADRAHQFAQLGTDSLKFSSCIDELATKFSRFLRPSDVL